MDNVRFTIAIPVYNAGKYLKPCVESALRQSSGSFEVLLLDDGSTDESGTLCDTWAAAHPNIVRTFHQENAGLVMARRKLLSLSRGEYVLFLDADDCLADNALARLNALIEEKDPDIILYKWQRIDEQNLPIGVPEANLFPEGFVSREEVLTAMARSEALNSLCLKLVRRSLFDTSADYQKYAEATSGEDLLASLPLIMNAKVIYYYPAPLYLYRANTASMTYHFRKSYCLYLTVIRPQLLEKLKLLGIDSEENRQAFYRLYLLRLWVLLRMMIEGGSGQDTVSQVMGTLHTCPCLAEARSYFGYSDLTRYKKLVLRLFYAKKPRLMTFSIRFYLFAQKAIMALKS